MKREFILLTMLMMVALSISAQISVPRETGEAKKGVTKNGNDISFTLRHDNVRYDFSINLYDNGSIWINMQPSNAQSCSYSGQCQELPKVTTDEESKDKKKKCSSKSFKSGMYVGGGIGI